MKRNLRLITVTAVGIALFVALSLCLQMPVFDNYYLCLGYVAMTVYCYSFGTLSGTTVGVVGVVLYSLLINGLRGMPGWAMGNVAIGVGMGACFACTKRLDSKALRFLIWGLSAVISTAVGMLGVKALVDSLIRSQPFLVRAGMNIYAFIADAAVIILALPICVTLDPLAKKLLRKN